MIGGVKSIEQSENAGWPARYAWINKVHLIKESVQAQRRGWLRTARVARSLKAFKALRRLLIIHFLQRLAVKRPRFTGSSRARCNFDDSSDRREWQCLSTASSIWIARPRAHFRVALRLFSIIIVCHANFVEPMVHLQGTCNEEIYECTEFCKRSKYCNFLKNSELRLITNLLLLYFSFCCTGTCHVNK